MSNLSLALDKLGQYDKASSLCMSCLDIQKEVLGEKHLNSIATSKILLPGMHFHMNNYIP